MGSRGDWRGVVVFIRTVTSGVALCAALVHGAPTITAGAPAAECVVIGRLGEPAAISDASECGRPTAPASTFKIPHALIALDTAVITADSDVPWDGTPYSSTWWQRAHDLESAIRWSVLPFFQRTARLIGRDRMRQRLGAIGYAADTFDGELTMFWLNGDLAVTPLEQYAFLQRFFADRLPIPSAHVDAVRRALTMPPGKVTNATGAHPFTLTWPGPVTVRIKTGNTTVKDERVSWAVGGVDSGDQRVVVVARVRSAPALDGTAGLDTARRALNAFDGKRGPR